MSPPSKLKRPVAVRAASGAVDTNQNKRSLGVRWPSRQRPFDLFRLMGRLEIRTGEPEAIASILRRIVPSIAFAQRKAKP